MASHNLKVRSRQHRPMITISRNPAVQAFYEKMIAEGQSHNMAEMLALQAAPQIGGTDSQFMKGRFHKDQFEKDPKAGEFYRAKAKAAGVSTKGKWYQHNLAAYPGDPEAWVSGTGDVKRICEKRNIECDGLVKHKAHEETAYDDGPYRPADDLIMEDLALEVQKNPDLRHNPKKFEDTKQSLIEKASPAAGW